jgi:hypothetical protein
MDGWMDGWMDGCKRGCIDWLQQSKIKICNKVVTKMKSRSFSSRLDTRAVIALPVSKAVLSGKLFLAPSKTLIFESGGRIWSIWLLDSRSEQMPIGTLSIPD